MKLIDSKAIIPFGKYAGQPVEILLEDEQYADWLLSQDWFKGKYSSLYTIIVNNFQATDDTPEHNALQARFLEEYWAADIVFPKKPMKTGDIGWFWTNEHGEEFGIADIDVAFEERGFDVVLDCGLANVSRYNAGNSVYIPIELKPSIGDDYPSILRQINAAYKTFVNTPRCITHRLGTPILCYLQYTGSGVSEEAMIKMLTKGNITVKKIPLVS